MEHDVSLSRLPVAVLHEPGPVAAPGLVTVPSAGRPTSPAGRRSLGDAGDGLIRALSDCGFTVAGVQSHYEVGPALSLELASLLEVLDTAIREIRHALCAVDAA